MPGRGCVGTFALGQRLKLRAATPRHVHLSGLRRGELVVFGAELCPRHLIRRRNLVAGELAPRRCVLERQDVGSGALDGTRNMKSLGEVESGVERVSGASNRPNRRQFHPRGCAELELSPTGIIIHTPGCGAAARNTQGFKIIGVRDEARAFPRFSKRRPLAKLRYRAADATELELLGGWLHPSIREAQLGDWAAGSKHSNVGRSGVGERRRAGIGSAQGFVQAVALERVSLSSNDHLGLAGRSQLPPCLQAGVQDFL